jgi:hypothetical protein
VVSIKALFFCSVFILMIKYGHTQVILEETPKDVKVFSSDENVDETDTFPSLKGVLHFGCLHPFRGRYPIFYEHAIGGYLGTSLGVGFTHADFFRSKHSNILFNSESGKMKLGLHAECLTKFYFSGIAIEDYYAGLNFRYSTFNYEEYFGSTTNQTKEEHVEALLIAGIQFAETSKLLVYDYYVGLGISNIFNTNQELVNIGGDLSSVDIVDERGVSAILRIGVKIGIKVR